MQIEKTHSKKLEHLQKSINSLEKRNFSHSKIEKTLNHKLDDQNKIRINLEIVQIS